MGLGLIKSPDDSCLINLPAEGRLRGQLHPGAKLKVGQGGKKVGKVVIKMQSKALLSKLSHKRGTLTT